MPRSDEVLHVLGPLARFLPHKEFTKVQTRVIPSLLRNNDNAVIAAPTGSGKTLLLEVAMLKNFESVLLHSHEGKDSAMSTTFRNKAVYICPIKALANEKFEAWTSMFSSLRVTIETGDQEREEDNLAAVAGGDIIITTPERWDSITRRWKEKLISSIVNSVGLLLLDEIHTVHEERGAALEAVVSRMKAIKQAAHSLAAAVGTTDGTTPAQTVRTRFIAISGTLPNIEDFAEWLQVPPHMIFTFSNVDRPVPLTIHVTGYTHDSRNPFAFDRFLSFKLFGHIRQRSEGKPTIVFCASRKETVNSAQRLYDEIRQQANNCALSGGPDSLNPSEEVLRRANQANDRQLRSLLLLGIAYHHAALTLSDRRLVESMFRDQFISVVCTTTTLALGVNLPSHLVIIKGTTFFKNGRREDLPLSEVAQMCGRAGRPGLDTHGIALILTTDEKVAMYERLRKGDVYTVVESQLHRHMIEHVNAEVALRTIYSYASGLDWVKTTFFWIRLRKKPQHYGLVFASRADELAFNPDMFAERLVERVLVALFDEECIQVRGGLAIDSAAGDTSTIGAEASDAARMSSDDGVSRAASPPAMGEPIPLSKDAYIETTRIGRSMARLYVLFGSVKTLNAEIRRLHDRSARRPSLAVAQRPHHTHLAATVDEGDESESDDGSSTSSSDDGDDDSGEHRVSSHVNCNTSVFGVHLGQPLRLQRVLALLCHTEEFIDVRLRQGDRGPLNEMNKVIKYPIKSGKRGGREVREDWHKSYVLVQGHLAQQSITEVSLRNDFARLWSVVPRISRFLEEYAWATGSFSFAYHAHLLHRCIKQRVWPDGLVLRQMDNINDATARLLHRAGYRSFADVVTADPRKIEALCSRLPPFGEHVRAEILAIPRCDVRVEPCLYSQTTQRASDKLTPSRYRVVVSLHTSDGERPAAPHVFKYVQSFLLLIGQNDTILLQRYIPLSSLAPPHASSGGRAFPSLSYEFSLPPPPLTSAASTSATPLLVHCVPQYFVGSDVDLVIGDSGGTASPPQKEEERNKPRQEPKQKQATRRRQKIDNCCDETTAAKAGVATETVEATAVLPRSCSAAQATAPKTKKISEFFTSKKGCGANDKSSAADADMSSRPPTPTPTEPTQLQTQTREERARQSYEEFLNDLRFIAGDTAENKPRERGNRKRPRSPESQRGEPGTHTTVAVKADSAGDISLSNTDADAKLGSPPLFQSEKSRVEKKGVADASSGCQAAVDSALFHDQPHLQMDNPTHVHIPPLPSPAEAGAGEGELFTPLSVSEQHPSALSREEQPAKSRMIRLPAARSPEPRQVAPTNHTADLKDFEAPTDAEFPHVLPQGRAARADCAYPQQAQQCPWPNVSSTLSREPQPPYPPFSSSSQYPTTPGVSHPQPEVVFTMPVPPKRRRFQFDVSINPCALDTHQQQQQQHRQPLLPSWIPAPSSTRKRRLQTASALSHLYQPSTVDQAGRSRRAAQMDPVSLQWQPPQAEHYMDAVNAPGFAPYGAVDTHYPLQPPPTAPLVSDLAVRNQPAWGTAVVDAPFQASGFSAFGAPHASPHLQHHTVSRPSGDVFMRDAPAFGNASPHVDFWPQPDMQTWQSGFGTAAVANRGVVVHEPLGGMEQPTSSTAPPSRYQDAAPPGNFGFAFPVKDTLSKYHPVQEHGASFWLDNSSAAAHTLSTSFTDVPAATTDASVPVIDSPPANPNSWWN